MKRGQPKSTAEEREVWLRSQPEFAHIFNGRHVVDKREKRLIVAAMKQAGLIARSTYAHDVRLCVSIR